MICHFNTHPMKSLVKLGFGSMIEVRVVEAIDNETQEDLSIHYVYIMSIMYCVTLMIKPEIINESLNPKNSCLIIKD